MRGGIGLAMAAAAMFSLAPMGAGKSTLAPPSGAELMAEGIDAKRKKRRKRRLERERRMLGYVPPPHGERECRRRQRQIALGQIPAEQIMRRAAR